MKYIVQMIVTVQINKLKFPWKDRLTNNYNAVFIIVLTLSSPIITSSINLHRPNLTFSGLPNVDTISPPTKTNIKCYSEITTYLIALLYQQKT